MPLKFEWDENKSKLNLKKHGIDFTEGKTVFNDSFSITIDDPDHSDLEARYVDIGISFKERILVVWYTERDEKIRLIGCRKANRVERDQYEEE